MSLKITASPAAREPAPLGDLGMEPIAPVGAVDAGKTYRTGPSPDRPERSARCDPEQVVPEGEQPFGAKRRFPWPERVFDSGLSGLGAGPALLGEHDQLCAGIPRVRVPFYVALGTEFVDELRRGLPGHVQVLSQLGDGGAAGRQQGEGEPVRGAQVTEAAALTPAETPSTRARLAASKLKASDWASSFRIAPA